MNEWTGERLRNGYVVSRSKESMNIAIISSIIKDGVKNMEELTRKYHSMQGRIEKMSLAECGKYIQGLQDQGLVGYYTTKRTRFGDETLVFAVWEPDKMVFQDSKKKIRSDTYFKPLFTLLDDEEDAEDEDEEVAI